MSLRGNIRSKQYGISLIEIMIGMTVSLILLGGLYQIFISSKTAHNRVIAQSRQQESGRFAMIFMRGGLKNAGYRSLPEELPVLEFDDPDNPVVSGVDSSDTIEGTVLPSDVFAVRDNAVTVNVGSSSIDINGVLATSDVISVRYQGAELPGTEDQPADFAGADVSVTTYNPIRNCLGDEINQFMSLTNPNAAEEGAPATVKAGLAYAVDTYYVARNTENDGLDRLYLYCRHARWVSYDGSSYQLWPSAGVVVDKLIDDVVSLQVRLGVDTSGDNVVDSYQTFSDNPDLSQVRSVQLQVGVKAGATSDFLEGRSNQQLDSVEAGVNIRYYTQTVHLRNLSR